MAIQIRRGTNANWEANYSNIVSGEPAITTDSERFLVGTSSGVFAEFSNINMLAEPYDVASSYIAEQTCNYKGQVYVCLAPTSGTWYAKATTTSFTNYNAGASSCVNHTIVAVTPTVTLTEKKGMV